LVKRHPLPRQKGNDGAIRVLIDLAEIDHKPLAAKVATGGDRAAMTALKDLLAYLRNEIGVERGRLTRARHDFQNLLAGHNQLVTTHGQLVEELAKVRGELETLRALVTTRSRQWWWPWHPPARVLDRTLSEPGESSFHAASF